MLILCFFRDMSVPIFSAHSVMLIPSDILRYWAAKYICWPRKESRRIVIVGGQWMDV